VYIDIYASCGSSPPWRAHGLLPPRYCMYICIDVYIYICIYLYLYMSIYALSCRSCSSKTPLIIGLFCRKWPIKIRHPIGLHHPLRKEASFAFVLVTVPLHRGVTLVWGRHKCSPIGTDLSKSPIFSQKSPTVSQKSPIFVLDWCEVDMRARPTSSFCVICVMSFYYCVRVAKTHRMP